MTIRKFLFDSASRNAILVGASPEGNSTWVPDIPESPGSNLKAKKAQPTAQEAKTHRTKVVENSGIGARNDYRSERTGQKLPPRNCPILVPIVPGPFTSAQESADSLTKHGKNFPLSLLQTFGENAKMS